MNATNCQNTVTCNVTENQSVTRGKHPTIVLSSTFVSVPLVHDTRTSVYVISSLRWHVPPLFFPHLSTSKWNCVQTLSLAPSKPITVLAEGDNRGFLILN